MASISAGASSPRGATAHSLEAYVLPQVVDVVTPSRGTVTALFVGEHDLVAQGQPLARLETSRDWLSDGREVAIASVVRAPISGFVSRCWGNVADVVWPMRRLFSIASTKDVFVVARFVHAAAPRLRPSARASILIRGSPHGPLAGRIISAVERPVDRREHGAAVDDGAVRVILRLESPPGDVLWPGMPAQVEV